MKYFLYLNKSEGEDVFDSIDIVEQTKFYNQYYNLAEIFYNVNDLSYYTLLGRDHLDLFLDSKNSITGYLLSKPIFRNHKFIVDSPKLFIENWFTKNWNKR